MTGHRFPPRLVAFVGVKRLKAERKVETDGGDKDAGENYVKKALLYIEDNFPYGISVSDIAFHVGVDRTYLYRLFTKYCSCSPAKYLVHYRLDKAIEMLENRNLTVSQIGMRVGFHDTSHFYKAFTARFGMSPRKFRQEKYGD